MRTTRILLVAIVAGLTLMATLQTSYSQVVPFHASGSDAVYTPCNALTSGNGRATHMGKLTISGVVIPIATDDPLVFDFIALSYDFTAANGDTIFTSGSGSVTFTEIDGEPGMFTAFWTADFDVLGGTGRFKNVGPGDAPLDAFALNDPLSLPLVCEDDPNVIWTYLWGFDGTIDLGRRNRK